MSKFSNKHEARIPFHGRYSSFVMEEWFSRHCIDDAMGVFGTQVWSYRASVLPIEATDTFPKAHGGAKSRTERAIERARVVMARQKSPHSP